MNEKFYVYVYVDPRKSGIYEYGKYKFSHEPFYIGKGKDKRIYSHLNESSLKIKSLKTHKIKKIIKEGYNIKDYIFIVKSNLSEQESFELEEKLINLIGRNDLNKGPLTNLMDGGGFNSGYIYTQEQNEANSLRTKNWIRNNPEKQQERIKKQTRTRNIQNKIKRKIKKNVLNLFINKGINIPTPHQNKGVEAWISFFRMVKMIVKILKLK